MAYKLLLRLVFNNQNKSIYFVLLTIQNNFADERILQ